MDSAHKLHVYTGDGKGKTTAAMGLALRMLGHGGRVLVAQFMKKGNSGELISLKRLPGASVHEGIPMNRFTFQMEPAELEETRRIQGAQARELRARVGELRPDLTVLDELAVAMDLGLVTPEDAFALIDEALRHGDAVVTGRNAPEALLARADYISLIQARRHPFDTGLAARPGIEW